MDDRLRMSRYCCVSPKLARAVVGEGRGIPQGIQNGLEITLRVIRECGRFTLRVGCREKVVCHIVREGRAVAERVRDARHVAIAVVSEGCRLRILICDAGPLVIRVVGVADDAAERVRNRRDSQRSVVGVDSVFPTRIGDRRAARRRRIVSQGRREAPPIGLGNHAARAVVSVLQESLAIG